MAERADPRSPTTSGGLCILGVDWGSKRIGLALSDPTGTIARPLPNVERRSDAQAAKAVAQIARAHGVVRIVVGLPRNMDGSEGPAAAAARRFGSHLAAATDLTIEFWDERLTTAAAERALVGADVSRSRRRRVRDGVAAAWMLQGYLAARTPGGRPSPGSGPVSEDA
ncbi:MAG: Holliday junction resolvase RuvX [Armatimonadota bacterium]|nr:Holliday junction resolvase RuvX [Armatimonadota bacterium]MDR5696589.1 Holliday junction resolvase RuvX [Armatimonadota bacterium]